jgi:putative ABC transport system permease protein
MPPSFSFPSTRTQLWVVEQLTRANFGLYTHSGIARLRDGTTVEEARSELNRVLAELPEAYPGVSLATALAKGQVLSAAITLKEATVGRIEQALWILLASVGLVLLVACANVTNLFLVRSDVRQREIAVRRALGADRISIARFFLVESTLLSVVSGMLGLAVAWGAVRILVAAAPVSLPRLEEVRLDAVGIAFAGGPSVLAGLFFGAIPLFQKRPMAAALHDGGRSGTAGRARQRPRKVLMGGQIALALVLLLGSALMLRSFQELRAVDRGFDPSSTLTLRIGLPDAAYGTRESAVLAHRAILDRLSAVPGVTACLSVYVPAARGSMFWQRTSD